MFSKWTEITKRQALLTFSEFNWTIESPCYFIIIAFNSCTKHDRHILIPNWEIEKEEIKKEECKFIFSYHKWMWVAHEVLIWMMRGIPYICKVNSRIFVHFCISFIGSWISMRHLQSEHTLNLAIFIRNGIKSKCLKFNRKVKRKKEIAKNTQN